MFKFTIIGASMALAIGTGQGDASNYATASSISCGKYAGGDGVDDDSMDSIYDYILSQPYGDEFGSGCNIRSFMRAECKLHPKFSVKQTIEDLFAKKQ